MGKEKKLKNSGSEAEASAVNASGKRSYRWWGYLFLLAAVLFLAVGTWFFYNTLGSRLLYISVIWGRLSRYYWILWLAGLGLAIVGGIILKCNPRKKKAESITAEEKTASQPEKKQPEIQEAKLPVSKAEKQNKPEEKQDKPDKQDKPAEKQDKPDKQGKSEEKQDKPDKPDVPVEKPDKPEENKSHVGIRPQNYCPGCNQLCKKGSKFCPYCGQKL